MKKIVFMKKIVTQIQQNINKHNIRYLNMWGGSDATERGEGVPHQGFFLLQKMSILGFTVIKC